MFPWLFDNLLLSKSHKSKHIFFQENNNPNSSSFKYIPYSYLYDTEENEYRIVMDEDMLDDIEEALKDEMDRQFYEECNRFRANEIGDLLYA